MVVNENVLNEATKEENVTKSYKDELEIPISRQSAQEHEEQDNVQNVVKDIDLTMEVVDKSFDDASIKDSKHSKTKHHDKKKKSKSSSHVKSKDAKVKKSKKADIDDVDVQLIVNSEEEFPLAKDYIPEKPKQSRRKHLETNMDTSSSVVELDIQCSSHAQELEDSRLDRRLKRLSMLCKSSSNVTQRKSSGSHKVEDISKARHSSARRRHSRSLSSDDAQAKQHYHGDQHEGFDENNLNSPSRLGDKYPHNIMNSESKSFSPLDSHMSHTSGVQIRYSVSPLPPKDSPIKKDETPPLNNVNIITPSDTSKHCPYQIHSSRLALFHGGTAPSPTKEHPVSPDSTTKSSEIVPDGNYLHHKNVSDDERVDRGDSDRHRSRDSRRDRPYKRSRSRDIEKWRYHNRRRGRKSPVRQLRDDLACVTEKTAIAGHSDKNDDNAIDTDITICNIDLDSIPIPLSDIPMPDSSPVATKQNITEDFPNIATDLMQIPQPPPGIKQLVPDDAVTFENPENHPDVDIPPPKIDYSTSDPLLYHHINNLENEHFEESSDDDNEYVPLSGSRFRDIKRDQVPALWGSSLPIATAIRRQYPIPDPLPHVHQVIEEDQNDVQNVPPHFDEDNRDDKIDGDGYQPAFEELYSPTHGDSSGDEVYIAKDNASNKELDEDSDEPVSIEHLIESVHKGSIPPSGAILDNIPGLGSPQHHSSSQRPTMQTNRFQTEGTKHPQSHDMPSHSTFIVENFDDPFDHTDNDVADDVNLIPLPTQIGKSPLCSPGPSMRSMRNQLPTGGSENRFSQLFPLVEQSSQLDVPLSQGSECGPPKYPPHEIDFPSNGENFSEFIVPPNYQFPTVPIESHNQSSQNVNQSLNYHSNEKRSYGTEASQMHALSPIDEPKPTGSRFTAPPGLIVCDGSKGHVGENLLQIHDLSSNEGTHPTSSRFTAPPGLIVSGVAKDDLGENYSEGLNQISNNKEKSKEDADIEPGSVKAKLKAAMERIKSGKSKMTPSTSNTVMVGSVFNIKNRKLAPSACKKEKLPLSTKQIAVKPTQVFNDADDVEDDYQKVITKSASNKPPLKSTPRPLGGEEIALAIKNQLAVAKAKELAEKSLADQILIDSALKVEAVSHQATLKRVQKELVNEISKIRAEVDANSMNKDELPAFARSSTFAKSISKDDSDATGKPDNIDRDRHMEETDKERHKKRDSSPRYHSHSRRSRSRDRRRSQSRTRYRRRSHSRNRDTRYRSRSRERYGKEWRSRDSRSRPYGSERPHLTEVKSRRDKTVSSDRDKSRRDETVSSDRDKSRRDETVSSDRDKLPTGDFKRSRFSEQPSELRRSRFSGESKTIDSNVELTLPQSAVAEVLNIGSKQSKDVAPSNLLPETVRVGAVPKSKFMKPSDADESGAIFAGDVNPYHSNTQPGKGYVDTENKSESGSLKHPNYVTVKNIKHAPPKSMSGSSSSGSSSSSSGSNSSTSSSSDSEWEEKNITEELQGHNISAKSQNNSLQKSMLDISVSKANDATQFTDHAILKEESLLKHKDNNTSYSEKLDRQLDTRMSEGHDRKHDRLQRGTKPDSIRLEDTRLVKYNKANEKKQQSPTDGDIFADDRKYKSRSSYNQSGERKLDSGKHQSGDRGHYIEDDRQTGELQNAEQHRENEQLYSNVVSQRAGQSKATKSQERSLEQKQQYRQRGGMDIDNATFSPDMEDSLRKSHHHRDQQKYDAEIPEKAQQNYSHNQEYKHRGKHYERDIQKQHSEYGVKNRSTHKSPTPYGDTVQIEHHHRKSRVQNSQIDFRQNLDNELPRAGSKHLSKLEMENIKQPSLERELKSRRRTSRKQPDQHNPEYATHYSEEEISERHITRDYIAKGGSGRGYLKKHHQPEYKTKTHKQRNISELSYSSESESDGETAERREGKDFPKHVKRVPHSTTIRNSDKRSETSARRIHKDYPYSSDGSEYMVQHDLKSKGDHTRRIVLQPKYHRLSKETRHERVLDDANECETQISKTDKSMKVNVNRSKSPVSHLKRAVKSNRTSVERRKPNRSEVSSSSYGSPSDSNDDYEQHHQPHHSRVGQKITTKHRSKNMIGQSEHNICKSLDLSNADFQARRKRTKPRSSSESSGSSDIEILRKAAEATLGKRRSGSYIGDTKLTIKQKRPNTIVVGETSSSESTYSSNQSDGMVSNVNQPVTRSEFKNEGTPSSPKRKTKMRCKKKIRRSNEHLQLESMHHYREDMSRSSQYQDVKISKYQVFSPSRHQKADHRMDRYIDVDDRGKHSRYSQEEVEYGDYYDKANRRYIVEDDVYESEEELPTKRTKRYDSKGYGNKYNKKFREIQVVKNSKTHHHRRHAENESPVRLSESNQSDNYDNQGRHKERSKATKSNQVMQRHHHKRRKWSPDSGSDEKYKQAVKVRNEYLKRGASGKIPKRQVFREKSEQHTSGEDSSDSETSDDDIIERNMIRKQKRRNKDTSSHRTHICSKKLAKEQKRELRQQGESMSHDRVHVIESSNCEIRHKNVPETTVQSNKPIVPCEPPLKPIEPVPPPDVDPNIREDSNSGDFRPTMLEPVMAIPSAEYMAKHPPPNIDHLLLNHDDVVQKPSGSDSHGTRHPSGSISMKAGQSKKTSRSPSPRRRSRRSRSISNHRGRPRSRRSRSRGFKRSRSRDYSRRRSRSRGYSPKRRSRSVDRRRKYSPHRRGRSRRSHSRDRRRSRSQSYGGSRSRKNRLERSSSYNKQHRISYRKKSPIRDSNVKLSRRSISNSPPLAKKSEFRTDRSVDDTNRPTSTSSSGVSVSSGENSKVTTMQTTMQNVTLKPVEFNPLAKSEQIPIPPQPEKLFNPMVHHEYQVYEQPVTVPFPMVANTVQYGAMGEVFYDGTAVHPSPMVEQQPWFDMSTRPSNVAFPLSMMAPTQPPISLSAPPPPPPPVQGWSGSGITPRPQQPSHYMPPVFMPRGEIDSMHPSRRDHVPEYNRKHSQGLRGRGRGRGYPSAVVHSTSDQHNVSSTDDRLFEARQAATKDVADGSGDDIPSSTTGVDVNIAENTGEEILSSTKEEISRELDHGLRIKSSSPAKANTTSYVNIFSNVYLNTQYDHIDKEAKRMVCECSITKSDVAEGRKGCQDDCLNRLLMIECGNKCPCGAHCSNKRFEKREYSKVEPFQTASKGWGMRACISVPAKEFIIEYVGEVLSSKQFRQRTKEYNREKVEHSYFMELKTDEIIDSTRKGNCSRFINHSCSPNSECQKWTVNGMLRVGIFSKRDINPGEEVTFDYKYVNYGKSAQKCECGAANCRGIIGTQAAEGRGNSSKDETRFAEEFADIGCGDGFKNKGQVLELCRLMVRAETNSRRELCLGALQCTDDEQCLSYFISYQGLSILWSWMADVSNIETDITLQILKVLDILPINNKTILETTKVLSAVMRCSNIPVPEIAADVSTDDNVQRKNILISDIHRYSNDLLERWKGLKEIFRIPKVKPSKDDSDKNSGSSSISDKNGETYIPTATGWERQRRHGLGKKSSRRKGSVNGGPTTPPTTLTQTEKESRRKQFEEDAKLIQEKLAEEARVKREVEQSAMMDIEMCPGGVYVSEETDTSMDPAMAGLNLGNIDPSTGLPVLGGAPPAAEGFIASGPPTVVEAIGDPLLSQPAVCGQVIQTVVWDPEKQTTVIYQQPVQMVSGAMGSEGFVLPIPDEDIPPPPSPTLEKLPPNWKSTTDPEGKIYYYNTISRESQWEKPTWKDVVDLEESISSPIRSELLDVKDKVEKARLKKEARMAKAAKAAAAAAGFTREDELKHKYVREMACHIETTLGEFRNPECKLGRISSDKHFKLLVKKLTHAVMMKELKHCRHIEDLEVNENTKSKSIDFVRKYMSKFGEEFKPGAASPEATHKGELPTPDAALQ